MGNRHQNGRKVAIAPSILSEITGFTPNIKHYRAARNLVAMAQHS